MELLLLPFSWLYGCAVNFRNWLFDAGLLKSNQFDHPVIGVGNLTVGGTGKTPHTEMLVRMLLDEKLNVATLSRGYKRKTSGFRVATSSSTAADIGDEPLQISLDFPGITVAVDKDRCHGISKILATDKKNDVIILDDSYQHRYVQPGLNILLIDHNRPPYNDNLLPAGILREHFRGKRRADIVIVTKCPQRMAPINFRLFEQELHLMPFQKLFFTTLEYGDLEPLFPDGLPFTIPLKRVREIEHTLLLTGIAQPEQLRQDLVKYCQRLTPLPFSDHHTFTRSDARVINDKFRHLPADEKIIITTAKDAARLRLIEGRLTDEVRRALYVLPVRVVFLRDEERTFRRIVMDYINNWFHRLDNTVKSPVQTYLPTQ